MSTLSSSDIPYIPLRNHTPYSLLQGAIPIADLIASVLSHHMPAVAVTDTGHLFGALEFSMACQKKGLHPIIGCQLSVIDPENHQTGQLILYAQSQEGYRNLCRLVSLSSVGQPPHLRGHITQAQLLPHTAGLLALTGGHEGMIAKYLYKDNSHKALVILNDLCLLFKERLYIEIARHEACGMGPEEDVDAEPRALAVESQLIDWAYEKGLPLVATNQAFFLRPEDYEAHDVLRCVALGRYILEDDRPRESPYHFFRSPQEMCALFADLPEALANTHHIMKRCHFLLRAQTPLLPSFPCEAPDLTPQEAEQALLKEKIEQGLKRKLQDHVLPSLPTAQHIETQQLYEDRLWYEYNLIVQMGFAGYFLIVADFVDWARRNHIPVGPGRGSGASLLVSWCLGITGVDPIRFNLFAERFLNPERVSMPDFDIDFCQERRDEVIAYVAEKYGKDHVAHIITFGTLQARAVLRDVGRVLQMPYPQVDKICKLVPHQPANPVHLKEALQVEPQLSALAENDESVQKLLDISLKLEGLYRHASTHAAGVIISPHRLIDRVPLYQDEASALPATEFSMKYVESAGLVKFDFLGLKTLTVLQCALDFLKHKGLNLSLEDIPLDDEQTFQLLKRVETIGLFQLESAGISDVLRRLQPEHFSEIVALVSLYRPGPMDNIDRFIACRHGDEDIVYVYPCLKDILEETFGIMVYQEQVLHIARVLAGYSLGAADLLRRAIAKKGKEEMIMHRKLFIKGTIKNHGGTEEKASQFFDHIAKFASYAFPKAHAVPYAMISYHTAYFKAHYPVEFLTALMISDCQNTDKLAIFVREAKRMKIGILVPCVNASFPLFTIERNKDIRYGLAALKNMGLSISEKICQERQKNGPFQTIFDFMKRCLPFGFNKKHLESLISAGAFDAMHKGQRSQLMASVDILLKQHAVPEASLLFDVSSCEVPLKECAPWSVYELLTYERQSIGFYLTSHPLDCYAQSSFVFYEDLEKMDLTQTPTLPMIGMIMDMTEKTSKSGQKYAFVQLSDPTKDYEVTLFSELLSKSRAWLVKGRAIFMRTQVRRDNHAIKLWVTFLCPLEDHHYEEIIDLTLSCKEDIDYLYHFLKDTPAGLSHIRCQFSLPHTNTMLNVRARLAARYGLAPEKRATLLSVLGVKDHLTTQKAS